jgi:hypothetical protein
LVDLVSTALLDSVVFGARLLFTPLLCQQLL